MVGQAETFFVVSTEENVSKTNTSGDIQLVYSYYLNSLELKNYLLISLCFLTPFFFSYGPIQKEVVSTPQRINPSINHKTQELTS